MTGPHDAGRAHPRRSDPPVLPGPRHGLPAPDLADAASAASLLADPNRAGIMRDLADGPRCVCEIASALGARESNVSNHLARLRDAGLVRASRDEAAVAAARVALAEVLR